MDSTDAAIMDLGKSRGHDLPSGDATRHRQRAPAWRPERTRLNTPPACSRKKLLAVFNHAGVSPRGSDFSERAPPMSRTRRRGRLLWIDSWARAQAGTLAD